MIYFQTLRSNVVVREVIEDDEINTCNRGIESDILLGSQEKKENNPNQRSIFKCKHCAKEYLTKQGLKRHEMTKHTAQYEEERSVYCK